MLLLKEHKDTLVHYIDSFPRSWKKEIRKDWDSFLFCTPSLRTLRNTKGPGWLTTVTAKQIRDSKVRCTCRPLVAPHTTDTCTLNIINLPES